MSRDCISATGMNPGLFGIGRMLAGPNYPQARDGNEGLAPKIGIRNIGKFTRVSSKVFEKAFKFSLHGVHFFAHVENYLNTGKIDAEIAGQCEDDLQSFEIRVRI